jgi:hypothetical protein
MTDEQQKKKDAFEAFVREHCGPAFSPLDVANLAHAFEAGWEAASAHAVIGPRGWLKVATRTARAKAACRLLEQREREDEHLGARAYSHAVGYTTVATAYTNTTVATGFDPATMPAKGDKP